MLSRHPSAYCKFHLTETALADILANIFQVIDSGNIALLSMLDLSAAFDTVDIDILISRLNISFGLSGSVLDWFKSYLTDRQQRVKHNRVLSDSVTLRYGVP